MTSWRRNSSRKRDRRNAFPPEPHSIGTVLLNLVLILLTAAVVWSGIVIAILRWR